LGNSEEKAAQERRKYRRRTLARIAHVTPHGLQQSVEIELRNLSTHGLGGVMTQAYRKGDVLLIKLQIPVSESETIQESLMGEISWIKPLAGGQRHAFGLAFCNIKQQRPMLYAYLKQLEVQSLEEMS